MSMKMNRREFVKSAAAGAVAIPYGPEGGAAPECGMLVTVNSSGEFERYFPEIGSSANLMTGPASLMAAVTELRDAIDAGQLTVEQAAQMMSQPMPDDLKKSMLAERGTTSELPPLFALATGSKNGAPRSIGALILGAPSGGMGGITGIPLALGLPLFASSEAPRRGVFAPEGAVDPDVFFEALAPFCHAPGSETRFASASELILVTTDA